MGLEVGIVGLPNVGKSTLFIAITGATAEAANYPFCTIEPNVGTVSVPDYRLKRLTELVKTKKTIPTFIKLVDIAGLVKGASKGEGLGNQFLSHIRQMDAIVHVVRCFEDDKITHVSGKLDPLDDLEVIKTELILADIEQLEKRLAKLQKAAKSTKDSDIAIDFVKKLLNHLENGKEAIGFDISDEENEFISDLNLITQKPYLYVANIAEDQINTQNDLVDTLKNKADEEGVEMIALSAKIEAELSEMDEAEKALFLDELDIKSSGLELLVSASYRLLNQITYFTAGVQEVRAWNITKGTQAPGAAGKIHTDFEKGFIRAEVFNFTDMDALGSEAKVKDSGLWKLEGKEYVVKNGDIMHFRFNV